MRTESKRIRPFVLLQQADLQAALDAVEVQFSEDEPFTADSSLKVDLNPNQCNLRARCSRDLQALVAPLEIAQVRFVATFRDDTQRKAKVILERHVSKGPFETSIEIGKSGVGWGPRGGLLSFYLVLTEERERVVGLPSNVGHILAMKHFSVNRVGPGADFPVDFWSPAEFVNNGYPEGSTVVVHGAPTDLRDEDVDSIDLHIYINDRLRAAIRRTQRTGRGKLVRGVVQASATAQLLQLAQAAAGEGPLPPESIGARLLKHVLKTGGFSEQSWKSDKVEPAAKATTLGHAAAHLTEVLEAVD